jgi:hypothetical protein
MVLKRVDVGCIRHSGDNFGVGHVGALPPPKIAV